jgi:hypothetical protein
MTHQPHDHEDLPSAQAAGAAELERRINEGLAAARERTLTRYPTASTTCSARPSGRRTTGTQSAPWWTVGEARYLAGWRRLHVGQSHAQQVCAYLASTARQRTDSNRRECSYLGLENA